MPHELIATIGRERAIAILRHHEQKAAVSAMDAAVRGGFRVVEFTWAVPGVLEVIAEFSRRPGLTVGAGTVMTVEQARRAVEAGARFLVSPVTDEAVIAEARALGVPAMPGVHTPTEMWRATQAGAEVLKLFPAPAGGPEWLRAVRGPLPDLRVVPTNRVTAANTRAWLDAGAFAVAYNAAIFSPELLAASRWDDIEARARELLKEVRHG